MATATMPRTGDTIKLDSEPQTFALRYTTGKSVSSRFPGGRVMFTCVDERKLFLNDEEASEFEHALLDKGVKPADFIRVTRLTHGRGGGFAIRVEPLGDDPRVEPQYRAEAPPADRDYTQALEKSIAGAQERKAREGKRERAAGASSQSSQQPAPAATSYQMKDGNGTHSPATPQPNNTPASAKGTMSGLLAGALIASVDGYLTAADYARSKGITVELRMDFKAEDIRQSATALLIEYWKSKGGR
jgi:hypothetical protein